MSTKKPIGRNNLDRALHRLFPNDANYVEMRSMMVNVLLGQFLPDGVVKGGSSPESERAHDLVDLQLMFLKSEIDLHAVKDICCRIFAYRNMHPWPPSVVKGQEWDSLYENAAENLPVLATCDEAVAWVNDLISKIANS